MTLKLERRKPITFAPDADTITPNILLDGNDFYPTIAGGVRTLPKLIQQSDVFPQPIRGATVALFQGPEGNQVMIVGSDDFFGVINTQALGDPLAPVPWSLQVIGAPPAAVSRWRFAFYQNQVFAVDGQRPPYVGTPTSLVLTPAAGFSPLEGNPPIASIVASSDYALWLIEPNSATWHSTLNPVLWTDSIPTQTASGTLSQTVGNITAARALRSQMILYKANSVFIGALVGPPLIWAFQEVSRQVGAVSHEAVVSAQDVHYFMGPDDFYTLDGYSLSRLPNQLRDWFFRRVDPFDLQYVVGRYDEQRNLIFWHYRTFDAPVDPYTLNEWICFNVRTGQWTNGQNEVQAAVSNVDMAFTSQPPGVRPGQSCGLLRSDQALWLYDWANGEDANPGSFFTTGDIGDRHFMFQLSRVRPGILVNNGSPTLRLLSTYTPGGSYSEVGPFAMTPDGWFNMLNTARLQRLKVSTDKILEMADYEMQINQVGDR